MGLHQIKKLLTTKETISKSEQATHRMEENICKLFSLSGANIGKGVQHH